MNRVVWRIALCALVAVSAAIAPALAQGTTASLSGVVTDSGGGVIPGATVVVKNIATNVSSETTTVRPARSACRRSIPACIP